MEIREQTRTVPSGWLALGVLIPAGLGAIALLVRGAATEQVPLILGAVVLELLTVFFLIGLFVVNPNQGRVLQLFGKYVGTVRDPGLRWANPFYSKKRVSLRVRNFETERSKVNDTDGNPIEIAAVVVWKVVDTAEAVFEVDDYEHYVQVQSEAAVRDLATRYPYDTHESGQLSLRGDTGSIAEHLKTEIQARLDKAGVETLEARITPPRLCAGDRLGDAATPASGRDHRGAAADRRGRGRHGGDGARAALRRADRGPGRGA